jgi:hypothetical protein
MPYTYKSLAFVWFITLGLFALTASGIVAGPWLILFLLIALATPVLVLRRPEHPVLRAPRLDPVRVSAASRRRPRSRLDALAQSSSETVASDVYRWENEAGAPRRRVGSGDTTELEAHRGP